MTPSERFDSSPPDPHGRKSGAWQRSERYDDEQITTTLTLYEPQWQALLSIDRAGLPVGAQEALRALATAHEREVA